MTAVNKLTELLQDYMWRQRPPLTPSKLADRVGISPATLYNMMNGKRRPELETLTKIAENSDISLRALIEAAGYAVDDESMDVWDYIIANVPNFSDFDEASRQRIIDRLKQLRSIRENGTQAS